MNRIKEILGEKEMTHMTKTFLLRSQRTYSGTFFRSELLRKLLFSLNRLPHNSNRAFPGIYTVNI